MKSPLTRKNLKGLFNSGKIQPPKKTSIPDLAEGDTNLLTEEQKDYVRKRHNEILLANENLTPNDEGYITQEHLRDELNALFGVNKSVRSYYRIWEYHDSDN